jgi:hypothetical protein
MTVKRKSSRGPLPSQDVAKHCRWCGRAVRTGGNYCSESHRALYAAHGRDNAPVNLTHSERHARTERAKAVDQNMIELDAQIRQTLDRENWRETPAMDATGQPSEHTHPLVKPPAVSEAPHARPAEIPPEPQTDQRRTPAPQVPRKDDLKAPAIGPEQIELSKRARKRRGRKPTPQSEQAKLDIRSVLQTDEHLDANDVRTELTTQGRPCPYGKTWDDGYVKHSAAINSLISRVRSAMRTKG